MNTIKKTKNLLQKIIKNYYIKEDSFVDFADLTKEEQNFFNELIDDELISKDSFPMSIKDYNTWKTLAKFGIFE